MALATQMLMMQGLGGAGFQNQNNSMDALRLQIAALGLANQVQTAGNVSDGSSLHLQHLNGGRAGGLYGNGQMFSGGGNGGLRFQCEDSFSF